MRHGAVWLHRPALLAVANLISERVTTHNPSATYDLSLALVCRAVLLLVVSRNCWLRVYGEFTSFSAPKVDRGTGNRSQRSLGTMLKCRTVWKKLAPLARHSSSACRQNVRTGEEEVDARQSNLQPTYQLTSR